MIYDLLYFCRDETDFSAEQIQRQTSVNNKFPFHSIFVLFSNVFTELPLIKPP